MNRIVLRPRPSSELSAAIVREGLLDLGLGVHHERAILSHRFADRSPLKEENFAFTVSGLDFEVDAAAHLDRGVGWLRVIAEPDLWARTVLNTSN